MNNDKKYKTIHLPIELIAKFKAVAALKGESMQVCLARLVSEYVSKELDTEVKK
jgi:hypothetical protein